MGQDPNGTREAVEEIEATRNRLADTVNALSQKADVRARAKENATARRDAVVAKVRAVAPQNRDEAVVQATALVDAVVDKAREVAQDPQQAADSARRAAVVAKQQPQWLAVAGGVIVLLAFRRLRRSRRSARAAKVDAALAATGRPQDVVHPAALSRAEARLKSR